MKEKLRYMSFPFKLFARPSFIVPSVSIYTPSGGGKSESGWCLPLHIELLRSGSDAFALDATRRNSWTFVLCSVVCCVLLATQNLESSLHEK